jgi:hypothetical protein
MNARKINFKEIEKNKHTIFLAKATVLTQK